MRSPLLIAALTTLLIGAGSSPAAAQDDPSMPLQVAERTVVLTQPDGTSAVYACITTGMHPGQGQAGAGYDTVTYPTMLVVQVQPGNDSAALAFANMEGLACRTLPDWPTPTAF